MYQKSNNILLKRKELGNANFLTFQAFQEVPTNAHSENGVEHCILSK